MSDLIAVTVLGHDRPGIIADVTGRLAGLGVNLEDSSMTLLRGQFAMTLVCAGTADVAAVQQALAPVGSDDAAGDLTVAVRAIRAEHVAPSGSATTAGASGGVDGAPGGQPTGGPSAHLLSVHGGDRPGIVSALVGAVAAVDGNVTDLTTRLSGDLYVVIAEVTLPAGVDVAALQRTLAAVGTDLGVEVTLREQDTDLL